MRELLKSMLRFSWAMPLFGASNMGSLLAPQDDGQSTVKVAKALDWVSEAARQQMGEAMRAVFQTGDRLQSDMLDAVFSPFQESKPNPQGMQMNSTSGQS